MYTAKKLPQLTPEREREYFQKIEEIERQIWKIYVRLPPAMKTLISMYDSYRQGKIRIHDIVQTIVFDTRKDEESQKIKVAKIFNNIDDLIKKDDAAGILSQIRALKPDRKILDTIFLHLKKEYHKITFHGKIVLSILKKYGCTKEELAAKIPSSSEEEQDRELFLQHERRFQSLFRPYRLPPKEIRRLLENVAAYLRQIQEIKESLIRANLHLVPIIVSKYAAGSAAKFEDLVQEGVIGLIVAIDKFEQSRGNRFSTYASWWIKQSIARSNFDQMVHVPSYLFETVRKIRNTLASDVETDAARLARTTGESERKIARALQYTAMEIVHLDECISEGSSTTFADCLPDESLPTMENTVEQDTLAKEIQEILNILSPREKSILIKRYGFDGNPPKTLEEIGIDLGYTRERIRQLEASAFKKLRHPVYGHLLSHWFQAID